MRGGSNAESAPLLSDIERQADRDPDGIFEAYRDDPDDAPPAADEPYQDHPDSPLLVAGSSSRHLEMTDSGSSTSDEASQKERGRWRRHIPVRAKKAWKATETWTQGPADARDYVIRPLFPKVQEFPLYLVERFLKQRKFRVGVVALYYAVWLVAFALVKRREVYSTDIAGWGDPQPIGCGVTYWGRGNTCGLDGADCRPFNGSGFPFRCPGNCRSYHVLNPRAVGNQTAIYQPLVIGGPAEDGNGDAIYRGDSYICGAGIHAGVVSNQEGGCGVVKLIGKHEGFVSSRRNGIESLGFDSYFPLSFTFENNVECEARDMRWSLLAISVVFTSVLSLFTASPPLFFFTVFTGIFWHVGMASDPPRHWSIPDLISNLVGKFLPAMFCAWVMFDKMGVRRTLNGLTAQIEKTVLWLGGCWVGALDNYTFEWIPIQRLNSHDLRQQPGARGALAAIILVLLVIAMTQVYFFRQEGRLTTYLKLYALFVGSILISLVLPDLNLRIHHYILALLLLPGTSMQTRPSLLYQGLLVGLFINGIARWGFDPVLQTSVALQGDAQLDSLLPSVLDPQINTNATDFWSINLQWEQPPGEGHDGVSVLVNDVERFRGYYEDGTIINNSFVWVRSEPEKNGINEYFRFGFLVGSRSLDYTQAGVWTDLGEWIKMAPGPSSVNPSTLENGQDEGDVMVGPSRRRI